MNTLSKGTSITYHPIGVFKSPYTPDTGAPRQGILKPDKPGEIHLDPQFQGGLKDLEKFKHIIVLYHLDQTGAWTPQVQPPASQHRFGVFATRSPKRPNPLGMAVLTLHHIQAGCLSVTGLDAFDGTPILDIKPYLPSVDQVDSPENQAAEKALGHHDDPYIHDSDFYR